MLRVIKKQNASRVSVIQYLARRLGDREEIPEACEAPAPQTSAYLRYLCGKKVINRGGETGLTAGDAVERSMCASALLCTVMASDDAPITLS